MPYKVLIVEDNDFDAAKLEALIKPFENFAQLVARCKTADEALLANLTMQPDILFVDIQLDQNTTGHEITKQLQGTNKFIVYVSADHTSGGIDALNLGAHFYIRKPCSQELVLEAFTRANKFFAGLNNDTHLAQREMVWLNFLHEVPKKVFFDEIVAFEAANNDCVLITTNKEYNGKRVKIKIGEVEEFFHNKKNIVKIHKSYVINIDHIKEIKDQFGTVVMSNGYLARAAGEGRAFLRSMVKL